ncbi:hypothetical protein DIPPA_21089 [Diplonema papillatum]|nr:hypothetical protein DIPPA_21089 [Diplonema papillatum]
MTATVLDDLVARCERDSVIAGEEAERVVREGGYLDVLRRVVATFNHLVAPLNLEEDEDPEALFALYDVDCDGFHSFAEAQAFEAATNGHEFDIEHWHDLCSRANADPSRGLSFDCYVRLFEDANLPEDNDLDERIARTARATPFRENSMSMFGPENNLYYSAPTGVLSAWADMPRGNAYGIGLAHDDSSVGQNAPDRSGGPLGLGAAGQSVENGFATDKTHDHHELIEDNDLVNRAIQSDLFKSRGRMSDGSVADDDNGSVQGSEDPSEKVEEGKKAGKKRQRKRKKSGQRDSEGGSPTEPRSESPGQLDSNGKDTKSHRTTKGLRTARLKTQICRNWMQGKCNFGGTCGFAHGEHEIVKDVASSSQ